MVKNSTIFPGKIRNRLIIVFLIPTVLLMAGSGWYYYRLAEDALSDEMGFRLRSMAGTAVEAISGESVVNFINGDEKGRAYLNSRERLRRHAALSDVERIYVFDKDRRSLLDTQENVEIGTQYFRLDADRWEIEKVLTDRETVASTMFTAENGKLYRAGYAPITVNDKVVAIIGVDAGVRFFTVLEDIRQNMYLIGLIGVIVVIIVSFILARGIEKPVGRLVSSARRIGTGELDHEIVPTTRDEIGFLAHSLNDMRKSIVERDRYLQMLQRGIAHEVRNPLGGMELFCDILTEELEEDRAKIAHVKKIRREVEGLKKVVNDFLDFTREVQLDRRKVDIEGFFAEILIHYSMTTEGSGIQILKQIDASIGEVSIDPEMVRGALFNLINNAIQAIEGSGTVTISAERDENFLVIGVKDTGKGISKEDQENIFTPFFTTKDSGTGLGLPFAKKIAENHNGYIQIESETGQGTQVLLRFPFT